MRSNVTVEKVLTCLKELHEKYNIPMSDFDKGFQDSLDFFLTIKNTWLAPPKRQTEDYYRGFGVGLTWIVESDNE